MCTNSCGQLYMHTSFSTAARACNTPSCSGVSTTSVKEGRMKGEESPCTGTDTQPDNTHQRRSKSLTTNLKMSENTYCFYVFTRMLVVGCWWIGGLQFLQTTPRNNRPLIWIKYRGHLLQVVYKFGGISDKINSYTHTYYTCVWYAGRGEERCVPELWGRAGREYKHHIPLSPRLGVA